MLLLLWCTELRSLENEPCPPGHPTHRRPCSRALSRHEQRRSSYLVPPTSYRRTDGPDRDLDQREELDRVLSVQKYDVRSNKSRQITRELAAAALGPMD